MRRDYTLFIKDIVESIEKIDEFTENTSFEEFVKDDKTASAVIRKLEIIGEAAKNIPKHVTQRYKELPWSEMARMRDKLIHGYFGVDYEIVWKVVRERLPEVKLHLERVLNEIKEGR